MYQAAVLVHCVNLTCVFGTKWGVFGLWCREEEVDADSATLAAPPSRCCCSAPSLCFLHSRCCCYAAQKDIIQSYEWINTSPLTACLLSSVAGVSSMFRGHLPEILHQVVYLPFSSDCWSCCMWPCCISCIITASVGDKESLGCSNFTVFFYHIS